MKPPERKAFRASVIGRVQGVGFRYSAIREARRLGLAGFVRNADDGSVEVVAEGDAGPLGRFLEWLREGPPGAYVRDVEVTFTPYTGEYQSFEVAF